MLLKSRNLKYPWQRSRLQIQVHLKLTLRLARCGSSDELEGATSLPRSQTPSQPARSFKFPARRAGRESSDWSG